MKKSNILILIISILVLSSLIPSSVSSETNLPKFGEFPAEPTYNPPTIDFKGIGEFFKTTFIYILHPSGGGADLFARGLLFILLCSILYAAAKKVPVFSDKVALLVAVIVSILGVRFLTQEMISGILLPYGTLAIVATIGLPYILFFYLIEGMDKNIRKFGWIFFGATMLGLGWMRWTDIGKMAYLYIVAGLIALFVFVPFDKYWHKLRTSIKHGKERSETAKGELYILVGEKNKLIKSIASTSNPAWRADMEKQLEKKEKQIKDIEDLI